MYNYIIISNRASSKCKILDEKFPQGFYEPKPEKIYTSYTKYLEQQVDNDNNVIDESQLALTSISQRFNGDHYYNLEDNGFYKLYHDIKLVCTMLIHYYNPGTRNYQIVDKFYKFASELILRECYTIGVQLTKNIDTVDCTDKNIDLTKGKSSTELDQSISKDFIKISTSYRVSIPETYHIKTKDMDLFSSIIAKSSLDHRVRELPNNNFEINKIIPQTNLFEEAPRLGFMAANTSTIPDPTLPPTEMMSKFLHPNWYALPTTTWLEYNDYKSLAPSFNENGTVLDATTRGIMWLRRIGYMDLASKDGEKLEEPAQPEEKNTDFVQNEDKKEEVSTIDTTKNLEPIDATKINIENVLSWKPSHYIDDDEIKAFEDGTQSKLVNKLLLKLQKLRKQRIMNKSNKPDIEETKLYYKVKRILKHIVMNKQVTKLPMNHENSFPIMQANYSGTIPVVRIQVGRKRKYNTRKN